MMIPTKWLEEFNQKMSEETIPHKSRPFLAISEWSRLHNCSVDLSSEAAKRVFAWFYSCSPPGAHAVGSIFTGAFYYDAHFWKVEIPHLYGSRRLDFSAFLGDMPKQMKAQLLSHPHDRLHFAILAVDCFDYGYGVDDIQKAAVTAAKMSDFAKGLFASADGHLRGTVALLTSSPTPNPRGMEIARFATEAFLKAFLAVHQGIDDTGARAFNHHLDKAVKECAKSGRPEFESVEQFIGAFPKASARYEGEQYDSAQLWSAYAAAQQSGAAFVRSVTDRDMRSQLFTTRGPSGPQ